MPSADVVVVTGAAGFLGHHLIKLLVSKDDQVSEIRCLDCREPDAEKKLAIEQELQSLKKNVQNTKLIKWIQGDIRDINLVERTLAGADCIIHCAAKIEIWTDPEEQDIDELESVNVCGTETLLKAAIRLGVAKFVYVSSFEVYTGFGSVYYATESTLSDTDWLVFGHSAKTKKLAELKVKVYSNNKLLKPAKSGQDSLNAIIVRFPYIYGEYDPTFISKILEVTKFLGGTLRKIDNVWTVQQPLYAGNAAWSLIKAQQRMDKDQTISGEVFHVTDDTAIGDPFVFLEPYLQCKGMHLSKTAYPYLPMLVFLVLFAFMRKLLRKLDIFGLFTKKRGRLEEAKEQDRLKSLDKVSGKAASRKRWWDYVNVSTVSLLSVTSFLNRSKASLRLDYEPLFGPEESQQRSIDWYQNRLEL